MRRLGALVCAAIAVACGPAARPAAPGGARPTGEPPRIRADRAPIEVRQVAAPEPREVEIEPAAVEFVPAVVVEGGAPDDIDEQIEAHGRLLQAGLSGVDRVEHWARLGDLYTLRGDLDHAAESYLRASQLKEFSRFSRADEVLFRRGEALRRLGKMADARNALYELIKRYPRSRWIADGYLAFGDYFDEAGAPDKARAFYEKALQLGQSRTLVYAHYRLGWIHYRAGDYQRALEQFFRAARGSLSTDVQKRIRAAAERGFVFAYVEVGLPKRALSALRRMSPGRAEALAALLAEVYAGRGQYAKSIEIYRALAADEHAGAAACDWQAGIVAATAAVGSDRALRDEGRRLGELAERGVGCGEAARVHLSALVRRWLARVDPASSDSARFASDMAERYLRAFPDAPDAGEIAYYLADALWRGAAAERDMAAAAKRWEQVAARFDQAARLGGLEPARAGDAEAAAGVARSNAAAAAARR